MTTTLTRKRKHDENDDTVYPPKKKIKLSKEDLILEDYCRYFPELQQVKKGIIPPCMYPFIKGLIKKKLKSSKDDNLKKLLKETTNFEKDRVQYQNLIRYESILNMHKKLAIVAPIDIHTDKNLQWRDVFIIIFSYEKSLTSLLLHYPLICKTAYQAIFSQHFLNIIPKLYQTTYVKFKNLYIGGIYNHSNLNFLCGRDYGTDTHFACLYLSRYLPCSHDFQTKKRLFHQEMVKLISKKFHSTQIFQLYLQFIIPSFSHYFGSFFKIQVYYPFIEEMLEDKILNMIKDCHWENFQTICLNLAGGYNNTCVFNDKLQKLCSAFGTIINNIK